MGAPTRVLAVVLIAGAAVSACGSTDAPAPTRGSVAAQRPAPAESPESPSASADVDQPASDGIGATPVCERVTPAELSARFGATFSDGRALDDRQCAFESDGTAQVLIAVHPSSIAPSACEAFGDEFEVVEIAGYPGFWDEAGTYSRVCLPDAEFVATLYGGSGDNSVNRDALIGLLALMISR